MVTLSSPAFGNYQPIPAKYTCDGINISPPLTIEAIPANSESLALVVEDPDAVSGTWYHWLVWNIPVKTVNIEENHLPLGAVSGTNSFGNLGYGGPCPPSGTHRYLFRLFALSRPIELDTSADHPQLMETIRPLIIEEGLLTGLYSHL